MVHTPKCTLPQSVRSQHRSCQTLQKDGKVYVRAKANLQIMFDDILFQSYRRLPITELLPLTYFSDNHDLSVCLRGLFLIWYFITPYCLRYGNTVEDSCSLTLQLFTQLNNCHWRCSNEMNWSQRFFSCLKCRLHLAVIERRSAISHISNFTGVHRFM